MMSRLVKGVVIGVIGALGLGLATPNAFATSFTGKLGTSDVVVKDGLLTGAGDYATATTLTWTVNDTDNPGFWTYTYTFHGNHRNISHIIIEVSSGADPFTIADVKPGSTTPAENPTTYNPGGANTGMPGSVYGLKWNSTLTTTLIVTIVTERQPVWGDFYARDGVGHHVFNAGFTAADPTTPAANGSALDHVLVPDTKEIGT